MTMVSEKQQDQDGYNRWVRKRQMTFGAVAALAVVALIIAGVITPAFLSIDNFIVILRAASITGLVALGMSYVTISGNLFVLSAEETAALSAVTFAVLVSNGMHYVPAVVLTLGFAGFYGIVQGVIIGVGGNPIVTTLGFGAVLRGVASIVSGNKNVRLGTDAADWIGTGRLLGVPTQSWAFVACILVAWFVLRRTRYGRIVLLTGANRDTARSSGIRIDRAAIAAVTLVAVASGLVGVFAASQFAQAKPDLFSGFNIEVITAVLVGGIALRGGIGSPVQAAFGAIFIAVLQNYMLINGFPTGVRITVVGVVAVLAASGFHLLYRERVK